MFSYRKILKKSWTVTWQHKYLWLLGLFAAIVTTSGVLEYHWLTSSFKLTAIDNPYYYLNTILLILEYIGLFLLGFVNLFSFDILTILSGLTSIIIVGTLAVSFIWLSISSQGGLVLASKKLNAKTASKKEPATLSFRDLLSHGSKHFWPILGFNFLAIVAIIFILALISLPLVFLSLQYSFLLTFFYVIGFIIFIPAVISITLIIKYAIAYNVLDNEDFSTSIKKARLLFADNWLVSLEMGVLLFLINFLIALVLLLFAAIFIYPYTVFAFLYGLQGLFVLLALVFIFLVMVVGSWLSFFQISSWTSLFLELKRAKPKAKLERIATKKK